MSFGYVAVIFWWNEKVNLPKMCYSVYLGQNLLLRNGAGSPVQGVC